MHQIHDKKNVIKLIVPTGLIAKSLLMDSKIYLIVNLFIGFVFVFKGLFVIYAAFNIESSEEILISRIEDLFNRINDILLGVCVIYFRINRSKYQRSFSSLSQILVTDNTVADQYVSHHRKIFRYIYLFAIVYEFLSDLVMDYPPYISKMIKHDHTVIRKTFAIIVRLLVSYAWILFVQFIFETCVHLQSAFIVISSNVSRVNKRSPLSSHKIQTFRQMYSQTGEIIANIDSFLVLTVLGLYIYLVATCHFNLVKLFHGEKTSESIMGLIFFGSHTVYLIFMTFHFVHVNLLSVKCYETVYSLSFGYYSPEIINEIRLFLERIGRHDVGFTFAKIFVISSNFVSSLATISLTIALAAPNLLQ
ncbi:uncharacterized protein LOC107364451 isoform X2 [Tetranychus urticae]|uniref:Gustatory receptor n=2 Tax=Tetranychus urticae TaxID=32264 RepID=T1KIE3_TETUR|nr:uncharacterized protein LOC107364451 isoform X2 [Tetranychus urticae]